MHHAPYAEHIATIERAREEGGYAERGEYRIESFRRQEIAL
jgi:hypothetical protein